MSDFAIGALPGWAVWVVIAVMLFWFVGSRLAEGFEGFAKVFGPLGRYWRQQASLRVCRNDTELKRIAREVVSEIRPADYEQLQNDLALMQKELDRMRHCVMEMQVTEDVNQAYLIHDTEWHFVTDQMLAENGIKPPKRIPYREFAVKYRNGYRLAESGWFKPKDDDDQERQ